MYGVCVCVWYFILKLILDDKDIENGNNYNDDKIY